jgi:hypothetical protein
MLIARWTVDSKGRLVAKWVYTNRTEQTKAA